MRDSRTGAIEASPVIWERLSPAGRPRASFGEGPRLRRLQASAIWRLYRLQNLLLAALARLRWPNARPAEAANVCVFRIGNIGDIACALPALRAVREAYPKARLTLLTSPGRRGMSGAKELLDGVDWIDEIIVYHSEEIATFSQRAAMLRRLRMHRFDAWVELPPTLSSSLRQFRDLFFTALVGPAWARGWRVHTIRLWEQAQSEFLDFPDEVERLLRIVADAGMPPPSDRYGLPSVQAVKDSVERALGAAGNPIAAIAPGAKRSTNSWPAERFGEVGANLALHGYTVVLLGGENDAQVCGRISDMIGQSAVNLAGRLTLPEACEVLRRCDLLVCVDSGVQHLAAAVGTTCVSLFSFWQFIGKWRPDGDRHVVIQKWVPCHTCFFERCPHDNWCMKEISAAEVFQAARTIEGATRPRESAAGRA